MLDLFKKLIAESRKFAKKEKLNKADVKKKAVKEIRRENRS